MMNFKKDVYLFTTENIAGYIQNMDLKDKSLLTLGSSLDQAYNALLMGASKIDVFDINVNARKFHKLKSNLILIGFMGTGKTSLGKLLAEKLGRGFIDIDQKIEQDAGLSIPQIFEKHGEKYFRELEKNAVKEITQRRGLVIATGGGTIKDEENLCLLKSSGVIVCLTTEPEEILRRTERRGERPMLDAEEDRLTTIKKLLAERQQFYSQADYTIDTTDWSPLQIMNDICKRFRL